MCLGNADAQTRRTATQAERERRAETARAERLRTEANSARRDVRQLDARLEAASTRMAEAQAAALAAEARLALLHAEIDQQTQRRLRSRDALESALIAAAFAERRIEPRAVRAGIFARAAAPGFAREGRAATALIVQARAQETAIEEERLVLAEAQATIDAERAEITTLRAQRRAAQTQLANDATAAERRARTLAAEARNLRDLAQRVQRASAPRAGAAAP
ncbi:MAG: hypothetical protein J0L81_02225, partial [Caulobacterales bacterium]|nr:hypothetical protein [Caulobacterales bacterium]